MAEEKITVYSYEKVWHVEKKVYNIGNIILPIPVDLWNMIYFAGAAFAVYVVQKGFPPVRGIPVVFRFGIIPYGIMYLLRKCKVDGKNPVKYFVGYIVYLARDKGSYLENFTLHPDTKERLILDWNCSAAYAKPARAKKLRRKGKKDAGMSD
ncbi:MAG: conjugal transfer protein [Lachnospiraceae bacterium]|nr:conjugal transfer protein [Lachnospiraceae bacterium]